MRFHPFVTLTILMYIGKVTTLLTVTYNTLWSTLRLRRIHVLVYSGTVVVVVVLRGGC